MSSYQIYVSAKKEILVRAVEQWLDDLKLSEEGAVSVTFYPTEGENKLTLTDEDTAQDDRLLIEVEAD